jgi:hypothetical protein
MEINNLMKLYLKQKFFLIACICFALVSEAQQIKQPVAVTNKFAIGAELQWYPAGWLTGPAAMYFHRPKHLFFGKLGVNIADRHNWSGINDNEQGAGFGGSLGYRYLFKANANTFFIGTRGELYSTKINWQNDIGLPTEIKGATRIIVYQPSIEVGYLLLSKSRKLYYLFSGGLGQEINIDTKGRPVGQGGMWLLEVSAFFKL